MSKLPPLRRFIPKNKSKYKGNPNSIIARSGWEIQVMIYLDTTDAVLSWSYERIIIPYHNPLTNRIHKYYPDFWVKYIDNNHMIKECILEVKPYRKTVTGKYNSAVEKAEILVNTSKFAAATKYCQDRNLEFKVMTEKDIKFIK